MAKKSFSQGIDAFFEKDIRNKQDIKSKDQEESTAPEKRATFLIEVDQLQKIKSLAYWERTTLKSILNQSLDMFFASKGEKYVNEALNSYKKNNPDDVDG